MPDFLHVVVQVITFVAFSFSHFSSVSLFGARARISKDSRFLHKCKVLAFSFSRFPSISMVRAHTTCSKQSMFLHRRKFEFLFLSLSLCLCLHVSCSCYEFQAKHIFSQVQIRPCLSFSYFLSVSMSHAAASSSKQSTCLHKCQFVFLSLQTVQRTCRK